MASTLICEDCNMTFKTGAQLTKHKEKFCIGGSLGDPNVLAIQPSNRGFTPDNYNSDRGFSPVEELENLKKSRAADRRIRHLEESMLLRELDELNRRKPPVNTVRDEPTNRKVQLPESYRPPRSRNTNSSMSIKLPTDDDLEPRYNPNWENEHRRDIMNMAEDHGRQVATIKNRNEELERQKEDIRRRLRELSNQDYTTGPPALATAKLLEDLRHQEEKNQKSLEDLKKQIQVLSHRDKEPKSTNREVVVPDFHLLSGNTLVAEIASIRQAYLQRGGNDPIVLAQMAQMLREAELAEQNKNKPESRPRRSAAKSNSPPAPDRTRYNTLSDQLIAFEIENQRLQRELLLMQEKNTARPTYREKEKGNSEEDKFQREMKKMQMEHLQKMQQLHQEMELTKHQMQLEKYKKELDLDHQQQSYSLAQQGNNRVPVQLPHPFPGPPRIAGADDPYLRQMQKQSRMNQYDMDPLPSSPYDPHYGFVIFHDFVLGLDPHVASLRIIVSLYNESQEMGEPAILPTTHAEPHKGGGYYQGMNTAIIGAKQPVPKCPAQLDMSLLIEMQIAEGNDSRLMSRAWNKLDIFDDQGRVNSGRWRVPMKMSPIRAELSSMDVNAIPQYNQVELYLRLVNFRDSDSQSRATISPFNANNYKYPPQFDLQDFLVYPVRQMRQLGQGDPQSQQPTNMADQPGTPLSPPEGGHLEFPDARRNAIQPPISPSRGNIPPPPSTTPPQSTRDHTSRQKSPMFHTRNLMDLTSTGDPTLGFQVIRVKHAEGGEGKIRLTAYYTNSGKVAQSETSPITCSTTAVRTNFKFGYHVFGQQEAIFERIQVKSPIILIVRFYLRRQIRVDNNEDELEQAEVRLEEEETMVAWGAIPILLPKANVRPMKLKKDAVVGNFLAPLGTHSIQLYLPPVPDVDRIPVEEHWAPKEWVRYGKATLRLNIFLDSPRPGSLTPSEASDDDDEVGLPENVWISHQRRRPPTDNFRPVDGFDLYIDTCRFLPDSTTITRVAGRVLSRTFDMIGQDISACVLADSTVFNPKFEYRQEFRQPSMPPTSTLLLKIYTIDRFSNKLTIAGYATLNIFVETGTERQPQIDDGGQQISLNEGAHQLRLYHYGPTGTEPLTDSTLRNSAIRTIPCASVLVRLVKAPVGADDKPLLADKVPQRDWVQLGLMQPMPRYVDRIYYSLKCQPTPGETKIFHSQLKRPQIKIPYEVEQQSGKKFNSDKKIEEYIRNQLNRLMDTRPEELDMTYVTKYVPKHGMKISLDSALNLPWSKFTHGHICLNPPGAFYKGRPNAAFDKLEFTDKLDLYSTNKAPAWKDGFRHYVNRTYQRYMTFIIHLQEIVVTVTKDNYKYGLMEQAWTPVAVFSDIYINTNVYQLPLYQGQPTAAMLKELATMPCLDWIEKNAKAGKIKPIVGASVFVRLCDGRRDEELTAMKEDDILELNTEYIPVSIFPKYSEEIQGIEMNTMVPEGKSPNEFVATLSEKFRNLVFKLYEEGKT
ncbi:uncharacterized protein LOC135487166 isoform X4 [Lineus longissimus]|uniref:uncharacterized protein LOC135487166 isoform X4 n=1 Tax=Lineus longissimus TaxID=88925 RepID=UPI00315CAB39